MQGATHRLSETKPSGSTSVPVKGRRIFSWVLLERSRRIFNGEERPQILPLATVPSRRCESSRVGMTSCAGFGSP